MTLGEPLRVLHVTRIPRTVTAFLMPLLREHQRRGDDVRVACGDGLEAECIEREGIPVDRYRLARSLTPWNLARGLFGLKRIIRRQRIDWVVTHTPIASAVARIAARLAGVRGCVYLAHGLPCSPGISRCSWRLWYFVERWLGRFTAGVLTMNEYDFRLACDRRIIRNGSNVFRIHGVGVDAHRLDELRRQTDAGQVKCSLGIPKDGSMVLFLGRTVLQKGVTDLLEAARRLVETIAGVYFVLAGEGPLDNAIRDFIRKHDLEARIRFLGWRRDADRLMAACDLFVLPSILPEGLPVSVQEAMACGKPVVSTRVRGCEDMVVDGVTGLLVPPSDGVALASAIQRLLLHPDEARRMGQAGRRRIDDGFRIDQCTREIMDAFDHMVGRSPAVR